MSSFYAIELGRVVNLPDISLRTECDWLTEGAAKKGAFSENFTLKASDIAAAFYGGTLRAVEKRFSVYGRLSSGQSTWLGYLQCSSFSQGVYQCAFVERPRDLWDEKVYRLATIPPYSGYTDVYTTWGDPFAAQWCHPPISYGQCNGDRVFSKNAPLYRLRLDAIVNVINSLQGLKIPVGEWMQTRWVYCVRGKVYSSDLSEGEDYDFDGVDIGSQYPLLWNLPNCSLYEFLSQLALTAGYATYVDGDTLSFISYEDFKPSGAVSLSERFIEGQSASYGVVSHTEGRIVTANDYEVATITAEPANGVAAGVGEFLTLNVYYSTRMGDYYDEDNGEYSEELDTDAIVLAPISGMAGVQALKSFARMVARHPKMVTYLLQGDGFPIWQPQYVPQLDGTFLPISTTSQNGVTQVEALLLANYEPEQLAEWEYVFEIEETAAQTAPVLIASLGEPIPTSCGNEFPVVVTSTNENGFAPYRIDWEWVNGTIDPSWIEFMIIEYAQAGASVEYDGISVVVNSQTGTSAVVVRPPLYAAVRLRITQLTTGLTEMILPPFSETPITDYTFNFLGCSYEEPGNDDQGGAPTFTIRYESLAQGGCTPIPCEVEMWPLGCNINSGFSQSYNEGLGYWEVKAKAVWPSYGSLNEVMAWDYAREHLFGSYTPGVSFRLTFQGVEVKPRTDYYATSLFAGGRRAQGYRTLGTLEPPSPTRNYYERDGRWAVYDFAKKTWQQYADGADFTPVQGFDPLRLPITLYSGMSMASRGDLYRVAINTIPSQGYCYALGTGGGTGPTCYLLFLELPFGTTLYNSYDAPAPRGAVMSINQVMNRWQAKWRVRFNSSAQELEDGEAYPPSTRVQGEGLVGTASVGDITLYPVLAVDLSEAYLPAGTVFRIPLMIQLNNARI